MLSIFALGIVWLVVLCFWFAVFVMCGIIVPIHNIIVPIHNIMHHNCFLVTSQKQQTKKRHNSSQILKAEMGHIHMCREGTHRIINIFRHTDIQIAFRTNNTIQNLPTHRNPNPDNFPSSGDYQLTCPECRKSCVGQTGSRFQLRYKEHRLAFYSNTPSSSYAPQLHEEAHPFGPIHQIMQVPSHHSKGPHLNTMEKKFYIYAEYRQIPLNLLALEFGI
jgi:hypothetical protein